MGASASLLQVIRSFRTVLVNRDLRRVGLAFVGFNAAEWATWIAILVFAYEAGGTAAAAAVGVVQLVPAAIFAPFAALLGDRYRRERVLLAGYVIQAATMGATAFALLAEASLPLIYVLAALAATAITLTRPAQGALLPSLARTAQELTSANAAIGWIESLSMFAGPALAGVLLAVWGPGVVFAVLAVGLLFSALLAARIETRSYPPPRASGASAVGELLGGFRVLARERRPRLVVSVMGAQFVIEGALDVLLVVLAYRMLEIGSGGVGFLNAALGFGGIAGAALTTLLVARRRLTPPLLGGAAAWGVGLAAIGLLPGRLLAPFLVALAGAGRPLIDVAGRTLLQRVVPDRALSRVFGVLEGLYMAGLAIGLAVTPVLFAVLGERATFVAAGAFMPVVLLLAARRLIEIDAASVVPETRLALLRNLPLFAPLSPPVLERLAHNTVPVEVAVGEVVIRQGEPGDRFYVVETGKVEVRRDGRDLALLGPGEFFGEISLLRDVPRTATVVARTSVRLYALERDDFLEAVTGHPQSVEAADTVAQGRLDEQRL